MTEIKFNFDRKIGEIKAMHAVGQPPISGLHDTHYHYLEEAHIPYSRLHDVGGQFGGYTYVDIPNIFRDFDADENDPKSYDFAFTDVIISYLEKYKCEPIYRLGVTIENFFNVRPYRIFPPKDNLKWARICEHIVRHYNEGWANGYKYGIKYWEIWNEPDNGQDNKTNAMWTGTPKEYYELYSVTAKHLKACFGDTIKVGGYASCGFYAITDNAEDARHKHFIYFFDGFIKYIKEKNIPIDFFSWHSYADVSRTEKMEEYLAERLSAEGLSHIETHCNEWNNAVGIGKKGTSYASANAAAMMCSFQNRHTNILCYYDARLSTSSYAGLFNSYTLEPLCTYYSFKAFGELYILKNQTECIVSGKRDGIYCVAAADEDRKAALIVNISDEDSEIVTNLGSDMKKYIIDETHMMTEISDRTPNFTLHKNEVVLIKNW